MANDKLFYRPREATDAAGLGLKHGLQVDEVWAAPVHQVGPCDVDPG